MPVVRWAERWYTKVQADYTIARPATTSCLPADLIHTYAQVFSMDVEHALCDLLINPISTRTFSVLFRWTTALNHSATQFF